MEKVLGKSELLGLNWHDILIVFSLWLLNYVQPWFGSWHSFTYNLNLQRLASFHVVVFTCECFLTVALSLICDFRHGKYKVYMYFLFLYGIFPLYGIVETLLPSFTLRIMMDWLHLATDIIFPIQFCAVFIQKPNISRMNSYIWITIFELVGALNEFLVPFVLPYRCPLRDAGIISIWVVLLLFSWQVLIFITYTYRKLVKPEHFPEKHLKVAIRGIVQDRKVGNDVVWWKFGRKTLRFSIFALLVIPVIFSELLAESLQLLEIRKDLNMQKFSSTSNMMPFGRFLGTGAIAAVLILVRKAFPKIADVLTLGVPHTLNLLAVAIITVKLLEERTGDVIYGAIPDKSSMVLLFINTDYNNRSACVSSEDFEPMRIRAMEHLIRTVRTDKAEVQFAVRLDPTLDTFVPLRYHLKVQKASYIIFMIQLGTIPLDRHFVINAVQVIRVYGTESIRPHEEPQYVWMTSISELPRKTELRVTRKNGSVEVPDMPEIGKGIVQSVPSVLTNISVVHEAPTKKANECVLAESVGTPKSWTVYAVVIHEHNLEAKLVAELQRVRPSLENIWPSKVSVHVITIMKLRRNESQKIPSSRILRDSPILVASYFIHGAATSLVRVGYLHLFWKDAPFRLRTFLLALSRVLIRALELFPNLEDIDYYSGSGVMTFNLQPLYALVVFQFALTLIHFVLARLFYSDSLDNKIPTAAAALTVYESASSEPSNKT